MVEELNILCFDNPEHIMIQEHLYKIAVMIEKTQFEDKP